MLIRLLDARNVIGCGGDLLGIQNSAGACTGVHRGDGDF